MAFCLIKEKADRFKRLIKEGGVKYLQELTEMTSEARRLEFMEKLGVDELTAKEVNALFESKLLLKYQNELLRIGLKKPLDLNKMLNVI